jgi:hypothetical protein
MPELANFSTVNGVIGDTCKGYSIKSVIDAATGRYVWEPLKPFDAEPMDCSTAAINFTFDPKGRTTVYLIHSGRFPLTITPAAGYTMQGGVANIKSYINGEVLLLGVEGNVISILDRKLPQGVGRVEFWVKPTMSEGMSVGWSQNVSPVENYMIDWGDGTITGTDDLNGMMHQYATESRFKVTIVGTRIETFGGQSPQGNLIFDSLEVLDLDGFGDLDASKMFAECKNMATNFSKMSLRNVTNANNMFINCSQGVFNINSLYLPKCTDTSWMFSGCKSGAFDIGYLNLPVTTNLNGMFASCTNGRFPMSGIYAPVATTANYMFSNCNSGLFKLDNADNPNTMIDFGNRALYMPLLTSAQWMFTSCFGMTWAALDLRMPELVDATGMFATSCSFSLRSFAGNVEVRSNGLLTVQAMNLPKLQNANSMFQGCYAQLSFGGVTIDLPELLNASYMFQAMPVARFSVYTNINLPKCTDCSFMFDSTGSYTLSGSTPVFSIQTLNIPECTNANRMFNFAAQVGGSLSINTFVAPKVANWQDFFPMLSSMPASTIDAWLIYMDQNCTAGTGTRFDYKFVGTSSNAWKDTARSTAATTAKNNLLAKGWIRGTGY